MSTPRVVPMLVLLIGVLLLIFYLWGWI